MKKLVIVALACVLIVAILLSCGKLKNAGKKDDPPQEQTEQSEQTGESGEAADVAEIEALGARLRTACNEQDVDGILDCIDPAYAKPLRATMKVMGEDQVFTLLCQLLGADSSADRTEFCSTLDTELSNISVDGDEATASLHYTYDQSGQRYGADADLTFKRIDGVWYISKLKGQ